MDLIIPGSIYKLSTHITLGDHRISRSYVLVGLEFQGQGSRYNWPVL
jgi:hypothetical protein